MLLAQYFFGFGLLIGPCLVGCSRLLCLLSLHFLNLISSYAVTACMSHELRTPLVSWTH